MVSAGPAKQAEDSGQIGRLRREIERLRALLRAHDIDPHIDHGH